jgi:hypothetical protein
LKASSLHKFHFNQRFKKSQVEQLVRDFLSDPNVLAALPANCADATRFNDTLEWTQLNTDVIRLEFFDRLEESGIVNSNGQLKRMMDEIFDGVTCSDRLRDLLLNPYTEEEEVYSDEDKKEFIYHIFRWLCVGGSMSQPDESITSYINTTKALYRSLCLNFYFSIIFED